MLVIGVAALIGSVLCLARTRRAEPPVVNLGQPISIYSPTDADVSVVGPEHSLASHAPTDEGVKLEQLKTLASLRDSGALTEAEFETEKRRILGGR